jgi:hypothetical protein
MVEMKTLNQYLMEANGHSNGFGVVIGFFLAVGNHVFGWMNNIQITAHWDSWFQAAVTGFLGATFAFFANKFWKFVENKFKRKTSKK